MIKLNLEIDDEKRKFSIPESWDEVTVDIFSNIWKIDRDNLTDIEITVAVIGLLTSIDEDSLYMMSPDDFNRVAELIQFTNTDVKGKQVDSIVIDGDEYFLKNDFNKLSMGEVISLELLIEKSDGNMGSIMPEMLCIFLRKKKDNGKLETFKNSFMDRAEMFKGVSITEVNDIFLFFSDGENSSTVNMKESLEKEKK